MFLNDSKKKISLKITQLTEKSRKINIVRAGYDEI